MALFEITRKKFLDVTLDEEKLTAMADMLWLWWCRQSVGDAKAGSVTAEAIVFCIARTHIAGLQKSIAAASTASLQFDTTDPDELGIVSPTTTGEAAPDLSAWLAMLATPEVDGICVRLRIAFEGHVSGPTWKASAGKSQFVFVGSMRDHAFRLHAVWRLGRDEAMAAVYQSAVWEHETLLMEAAEIFSTHQSKDQHEAALYAWQYLGKTGPKLFSSDQLDAQSLRITRTIAELPDERNVAAFVRRALIPIITGFAVLVLVSFHNPFLRSLENALVFVSILCFLMGGARLIWKIRRLIRYRLKMRRGLDTLYSRDVAYRLVDVSLDQDPLLRKYSTEISSLGALHLCDVSIETAKHAFEANRVYIDGDTTLYLGVLRKSGEFKFFPSKPVILIATRFVSGGKHVTQNRPRYRHLREEGTTLRCAPEDCSLSEWLELHRVHVARRVAAGESVKAPASTPLQQLEKMLSDHEISKASWFRSPYSWSDAFHDAFKITRREFLRD